LNLRALAYFVALARERHFARAADSCGVTQPTLSAGIVALETELGQRLILRERKYTGLTAEGLAMLPWAQRVLADKQAMVQAVAAEGGALVGELRLGAIPASLPVIGAFARSLRRRNPGVTLNVRSMTSREIERALIAYELDAGLTYLHNEPPAQVLSVPLYREYFRFAACADSALAQRDRITWTEAAAAPLCLLHQGMQNRRILDAHLATLGIEVHPVAIADSYVTLLSLVAAGEGHTILPHSYGALLPTSERIRMIDFIDPAVPHEIGLIVHDRPLLSPIAKLAYEAASDAGVSGLTPDFDR
jgi:DNA-binding transcriptional LysR family regulator